MTDIYVLDDDALEQIVCGSNPSSRIFVAIRASKEKARAAIELAMLAVLSIGATMCAIGLAMHFIFQ